MFAWKVKVQTDLHFTHPNYLWAWGPITHTQIYTHALINWLITWIFNTNYANYPHLAAKKLQFPNQNVLFSSLEALSDTRRLGSTLTYFPPRNLGSSNIFLVRGLTQPSVHKGTLPESSARGSSCIWTPVGSLQGFITKKQTFLGRREGRREGGKEEGKEGAKEGRKKGRKEGRREGKLPSELNRMKEN